MSPVPLEMAAEVTVVTGLLGAGWGSCLAEPARALPIGKDVGGKLLGWE